MGAASGEHDLARSEHDWLIRWDTSTGHSQAWDTDASIGEAVFAPRDGATEKLDGYYMTLARSVPNDRSWLYMWDAADFPSPPVARVAIPATVPNGLHASWFPAAGNWSTMMLCPNSSGIAKVGLFVAFTGNRHRIVPETAASHLR